MGIPIIGQPKVTGWFITLQVQCPCAPSSSLLIPGVVGTVGVCASCGRGYRIKGIHVDERGAQVPLEVLVGSRDVLDAAPALAGTV